jgi:asparagine synthase (glutamine-hydrolysing)
MSAIAGIIQFNQKSVDREVLKRMQAQLLPYGRDAQHQWQRGIAGCVRTLLRTTPEDSFDHQPLVHVESGVVLLFDGRLDNRKELADKLRLDPTKLKLMADSDVALHACLKWDIQAVEYLLGDFAIACWNQKQQKLWLARDPLGHRPLFWYKNTDFFSFATMPKALFSIPGVPRAICEESLANYLALLPQTDSKSQYKDIYRVKPGEILILKNSHITTQKYHEFDSKYELKLNSDDEYLEAFQEHLDQAIACRLRSSGAIASHLSSGFDSSTVTALAASRLQQQNKSLLAYTAVPREGFNGPVPKGKHADESIGASALAKRFDNIEHVLIRSTGHSSVDILDQLTETRDRSPLNGCNITWLDAIQKDAQNRKIKVLLTGQKGNMSISYTGEHYLPSLFGKRHWKTWWNEARAYKEALLGRSWRRILGLSVGPYLPPMTWLFLNALRGSERRKLTDYTAIHPDFLKKMGGEKALARKAGWDTSYRPWANGKQMRIAVINRMDQGNNFVASNAYGLEVRDPTGDLRLLEFCLSVPESQYLRNGQTRWLLHRLMNNILPPEILFPKTKGLQAADWYEGIEKDLPRIRDNLAQMIEHGGVGKYLDLDTLQQSLEDWPEDGWNKPEVIQAYRLKLLRGMSVGSFIRYVEGNNR